MGVFGYTGGLSQDQMYLQQVLKVINAIGYMSMQDEFVTIFVPKLAEAISVAEIVAPELSYKVIEYNHHELQGDLERKKSILLLLEGKLEAKREELKQINHTLADNLFFLFNNLNLRHNNCDKEGKDYHALVAEMPEKDLENWYDETYQLCLLSFLELDNIVRTEKIKELKSKIKNK